MYLNRQHTISEDALKHYFDGVERLRLDAGAISRKSGTWLAMREKLIKLPEPAFDAIMKSIDAMVESFSETPEGKSKASINKKEDRQHAMALFEKVAEAEINSHSSVATSEIRKI